MLLRNRECSLKSGATRKQGRVYKWLKHKSQTVQPRYLYFWIDDINFDDNDFLVKELLKYLISQKGIDKGYQMCLPSVRVPVETHNRCFSVDLSNINIIPFILNVLQNQIANFHWSSNFFGNLIKSTSFCNIKITLWVSVIGNWLFSIMSIIRRLK